MIFLSFFHGFMTFIHFPLMRWNPTPRIALFVRLWQNFSRIIHTCSIVKHYGYMHHVYFISSRLSEIADISYWQIWPKVQNFAVTQKIQHKNMKKSSNMVHFALKRPKVVSSFLSWSPVWPSISQKPHQKITQRRPSKPIFITQLNGGN